MVMLGIKFACRAILSVFRIKGVGLEVCKTSRVYTIKLESLTTSKGLKTQYTLTLTLKSKKAQQSIDDMKVTLIELYNLI